MRLLIFFSILVPASAQMLADPRRLPERWKSFEGAPSDERMKCAVEPVQPRLNLGFRFQTGYTVEIPLRQYSGSAPQRFTAIVRVTPETAEREPVWLVSRIRIPAPPGNSKATAEFGGAFLIGEGKYQVHMLLVDAQERVCRKRWSVRAKLSDDVRSVRPGLPAGAVDDVSLRRWGRMTATSSMDERRYNLSVLVHAAATMPRRVRLRSYDRTLLMSALVSMIERLAVRNVRLTIFNMDRQKEVFHTPELTAESFREAADALNGLELGVVDYGTLQNRGGHVDLLSGLLNRELASKEPPDAIILLGPVARWTDRLPAEILPRPTKQPVYYVQLRPWRLVAGVQADTIERTVRKLGGRTKQVYSPEDFAEAIQELEKLLGSVR